MTKITLIGMYNMSLADGKDMFANLYVPDGMNKDALIGTIIRRGGEYEVLYPNLPLLTHYISIWSMTRKWSIDKLYNATMLKYEPLENYDRQETWTDTGTRTGQTESQRDVTTTDDRALNTTLNETTNTENHITDSVTGTEEGTVTENVSAYDETTTYSPKNQSKSNKTTESNGKNDGTGKVTVESTNGTTDKTSIVTSDGSTGSNNENTSGEHTGRIHGNIGVTTSQQMLQSELDIALFSLYDTIAELFLADFVIPIL